MNKKIIGFLLAIPALIGFGLTSCSDESAIADKETTQDKLVNVTLTAQISDQTRAFFDPEKHILKFKWELNDEIQVVNATTGNYIGKLIVSEVTKDPRVCSFAGSLRIPAGKVKLNFYYLGKGGKASFNQDLTLNDYLVDFSAQDGTANFADHDILMSTGEYENVQDGNLGMVNFDRDFAYGRFILKYNGEELNLDGKSVTISANTGKLYNKATLNFQKAAYVFEEGTITVTPKTNDFYVSFFPTDAVNLKFTVDEFDGTKMKSLMANIYYTANTEGEPIVVEMRHSDGRDDKHPYKLIYKSNYEGGPTDAEYTWEAVSPYEFTVKTYEKAFAGKADDLTREGYEFTGWNTQADGKGQSYSADDKFEVTYPDNTTGILYAQWKEVEYTWTITWKDADNIYDTDNVKGVAPAKFNTSANKPADPSKDGYRFTGWTYEGKTLPSEITLVKDNLNVEIVANWEKATHTVAVYAYLNDGTDNHSVHTDINVTLPHKFWLDNIDDPTRTGYKFMGWGATATATTAIEFVTFDTPDPISVYAIWKKEASSGTIVAPGANGSEY